MAFHACAMASAPAILYLGPGTLHTLAVIERLRDEDGVAVYATMDAGPHVKALCHAADAERVERALATSEGVVATSVSAPGAGIEVLECE